MTASGTGSSHTPQLPQKPFRLTHLYWYLTLLATAFLLALLQPVVWAQGSAQPGTEADPPGRVARLNLAEGAVSFAPAGNGEPTDAADWSPAVLNRPLTSGDKLWTGPQSRSELYVGSTAVRMNAQTSLDFLALDDNATQLRLAQGTLKLRVRTLFEGQRLEVDTPNLAFVVSQPGDYRLDVDPANNTTRVVAQSGSGVIYGDGARSVTLGSQQQANFTGTQLVPAGPGAAQQDSFDVWAANRDRLEDQSVSARYVPRETVGYQQLDTYGSWSQDPAYGAVWMPREVPAQWAPYRDGHWAWVSPWGWTWVDDAPWGFAPFHYGRWAQIGPRWAWVPGRLAPRPVYAPALVAFVGGSSGGVNWTISIGGAARPGVGWFPLAPGEAYRPAYRVSPRYITQVNHNIVVNNTVNVTNVYRYQRQPGAVTAVSRDDFTRGRPVRGQQHALSQADLGRAQVVADRSAIPQRPSREDMQGDRRERPRPSAVALPPPAAVARPVVSSRDDRRDERRDGQRGAPRQEEAIGQRALREQAQTDAQNRAAAAETRAAANRSAAEQAQRTQQQAQREQQHQQKDLARQQEQLRRQQGEESIGQRALREQAQTDAQNRAAAAEARAAANRSAAEQAQRTQQQAQREQQHQQRDLARQQEQLRRQQGEESIGQRALREQAQTERENARQQQAAQRQQQQQQRAQQESQRQPQIQRDQPRTDVQERQPGRQANATGRGPRGEGEPNRNREQ